MRVNVLQPFFGRSWRLWQLVQHPGRTAVEQGTKAISFQLQVKMGTMLSYCRAAMGNAVTFYTVDRKLYNEGHKRYTLELECPA